MARYRNGRAGLLAACAILPMGITGAQAQQGEAIDLDDIVITASGFEQQIEDAPATITVISSEDLEGRSYSGITDVLDDVPGITIESSSGKLPGSQSIVMRGLGEDYILFLVDGKPIGNSQNAYYNGWGSGQRTQLLPPPALIERIEVIRGPMSSLYGSGASGGVINVITKPTADRWTGTLTVGQTVQENEDSASSLQTSYFLTGPLVRDRLGLTFYGSTFDRASDDYEAGFSGVERRSNGARLRWVLNDANELELDYSRTEQETTRDLTNDTREREIVTTRQDAALTHRLSWGNGFETTSYIKKERVDIDEGSNLSAFEQLNFNTKTLMTFGRHMVTAGLDYRLEKTFHDVDRFPGSRVTDLERWHASIFAEDEFAWTDDFTLTLGARYDQNEKFGSNFTPRIYGVYHMSDALTLKGGVSGGYTVPDLKQTEDGIVEQAGRGRGWDQGNTDLTPEESTNYELGMVWTPRSDLQVGVTAYHTKFTDKIDREDVCSSTDVDGNGTIEESEWSCTYNGETRQWLRQYVNVDAAVINGVEATLDYRLGDVDLSANYTFSHSEITKGSNKGERLNSLPRHMVNLGIDWQATDELSLWSKVKFRGETNDVLADDRTPGYTIVDVGANYRFNQNVMGSLGIYNAFDKSVTNEQYGALLDGRRYYVGLTSSF